MACTITPRSTSILALACLMAGCAAVPGAGPTVHIDRPLSECIPRSEASYERKLGEMGFAVQGIGHAMYTNRITTAEEGSRKKYRLAVSGELSRPILPVSYVGYFLSLATAFVIPTYLYNSYMLKVIAYNKDEVIGEVTGRDSMHGFISLFAGGVDPDSRYYPSRVEEEIGRRLADKVVGSIVCDASPSATGNGLSP